MALRFRHGLSLVILGLWGVSALLAQSRNPGDLGVGKLLVVPRNSPDPNFTESVVLLVHYAADGTVGLMINRQTKLPVSRVLHDLKGSNKYPDPVYAGGPVQIEAVQALLQSRAGPHDATHLFGNVYLVSQKAELEKSLVAGKDSKELRIYLGYCGWSPGQLENEVNRGGWYIFDGSDGVVFDSNPSTLWSRMIARTEEEIVQLQSVRENSRMTASAAKAALIRKGLMSPLKRRPPKDASRRTDSAASIRWPGFVWLAIILSALQ